MISQWLYELTQWWSHFCLESLEYVRFPYNGGSDPDNMHSEIESVLEQKTIPASQRLLPVVLQQIKICMGCKCTTDRMKG